MKTTGPISRATAAALPPATCGNCRVYLDGLCRLNPTALEKEPGDTCGQHRRVVELGDWVELPIEKSGLSKYTVAVCKRVKISTLEDVIDEGRLAIRTHGYLDRNAIVEISLKLAEFGVRW